MGDATKRHLVDLSNYFDLAGLAVMAAIATYS